MYNMNLTKEKLNDLWENRDQVFSQNRALVERYDFLKNLFEKISNIEISFDNGKVFADKKEILIEKSGNRHNPPLSYFGCKEEDLTAGEAFIGIKNMCEAFPDYKDIITDIGCMMGGFDVSEHHPMRNEYRIISNNVTAKNDDGTLISEGQVRHPSSHFADNNMFFNVIFEINNIKKGTFKSAESKIVLRWVQDGEEDDAEKWQRDVLDHRFPYKFFYMWTHYTLKPLSLMAFRNLIHQEEIDFHYRHDWNVPYEKFIPEWDEYAKSIMDMIPEDKRGEDFIHDFSLLISVLMCGDTDIKNVGDLLNSGNKAIVLWGPPGTGKTYSAKRLVCQELGIEISQLEKFRFNPKENVPEQGCWNIVQFHPSYTYEDFIGGIMPKLDGNSLSYSLKTGIFKQMCDEAARHENNDKKFFLIIDEINRADLSSIFGELMYALEYRDEKIQLPNFTESFTIPGNVYLIGTMNNVDKSLATFDLALRRRFGFYKLMPDIEVLRDILCNVTQESREAFIECCKDLNRSIATDAGLGLGKDFQIGHAYYAKIKDFLPIVKDNETIKIDTYSKEKLWMYHLESLLEEYLGNRIDDPSIVQKMTEIKDNFIK